jgi:hypothetical protein
MFTSKFRSNFYLKFFSSKNFYKGVKILNLNHNKLNFGNLVIKHNFCTKNTINNEISKIDEMIPSQNDNSSSEINFSSYYQKKSKEAAELLKVLNSDFENLDVEKTIKTLLLCGHFKNYQPELLKKLEKKISKLIPSMNEEQFIRTMTGYTLLNYRSTSINFVVERYLSRNLLSMKKNNFVTLIKCIGKNYLNPISHNLFILIRGYIEKNINKFSLFDLCDIFLNIPKILKIIPTAEDKEIYKKIFLQILPYNQNLDNTRLVNFYFLIYSDKKKNKILDALFEPLYPEYKYEEKFLEVFSNIDREKEINNKLTYQIILTHHFANENLITEKISLSENFNYFIFRRILENLNSFTPEEINSVITILAENKKNFKLSQDQLNEIFSKFNLLVESELNKMSSDEVILYMQSILIILKEKLKNKEHVDPYKNILLNMQEQLVNKNLSSLGLFQCASLLELVHHFKNIFKIQEYFPKIDLDTLAEHILRLLSMKTTEEVNMIIDDYYLIMLSLYDMRYSNKNFWSEFLKYTKLFNTLRESDNIDKNSYLGVKLEKIKILSDEVKKEYFITVSE